ncbi:M90 family metallopeptidase [Sulfurimonas sp. HSL1-2]|uniref:M90 family metallopeptidase n=1 Tax=Thiomicrolovo zhangzhouensis TaxID=3131933 RepID=UPI0031F80D7B
MTYPLALLSIFFLLFLIWAFISFYRSRRQSRLLETLRTMPFPEQWRRYLERTLHYPQLENEARRKIERAVLRFVHTKPFSGVGIEVTEEMKVLIAFYACMMVRHRPESYDYPTLGGIIIYADGFLVDEFHEHGGIVSEQRSVLDGQSSHDTVVFAWPDVEAEAYHPSEYNVVIHEFAHLLDFEDGLTDGLPLLPKELAPQWEHHLTREFSHLRNAADHGHLNEKQQLLGTYAATDMAEFFAVASERYFMQPDAFEQHYPELYTLFSAYYR